MQTQITCDDLDLQAGQAITRGADNKGKRDDKVKLHPVVVEHLKALAGFSSHVFPWNHDRRTLQTTFAKTADALQALMRHKSNQTIQVYISLGRQMDAAVASLHVPEVLRPKTA